MIKKMAVILALLLAYIVIGCLVPFVNPPKVSEQFKQEFRIEDFHGDGSSGDRASVVETNQDALKKRIEMIHQAEHSIVLSTFDMREGETTDLIISSLLEAADRGVEVNILVDGLYGSLHMNPHSEFYVLGSNPNIQIKFYSIPHLLKPWNIHGRMHDKYLITDERLLLLGGRNTFDYFLGEKEVENKSYDREVFIVNEKGKSDRKGQSAIDQVLDYYSKIWNDPVCKIVLNEFNGTKDQLTAEQERLSSCYTEMLTEYPEWTAEWIDYTSQTIKIEKATLIFNPTHTLAKEPWVWYQLQQMMRQAEKRVWIQTPYIVCDNDIYAGLNEITNQVEETMLLVNSPMSGDNFMASSDYIYNKDKIIKTGFDIYEYCGEFSSHGKSILIDHDLSVIGSYNLDMRSTYIDTELMLVIHGEEFNQSLEGYLLDFREQTFKLDEKGDYIITEEKEVPQLSLSQKAVFAVTSRLFQLIHFLI